MIYDKWSLTKSNGTIQFGGKEFSELQNYLFKNNYVQLELDGVLENVRYTSISNHVTESIEFEKTTRGNFICDETRPIVSSIRKRINISAVNRVKVVFDDDHVVPLSRYTCESKKRVFRTDILKTGDVIRFTLHDRREDECNDYGDIDECIGYVKLVRPLDMIILFTVESHTESINITISDLFDVHGCRGGNEDLVTLSIEVLDVNSL